MTSLGYPAFTPATAVAVNTGLALYCASFDWH